MTAELLPDTRNSIDHASGDEAGGFLDGLAHLYPFVLVLDEAGQSRWMSSAVRALCKTQGGDSHREVHDLTARIRDPGRAAELRVQLRARGFLVDEAIEIEALDGEKLPLEFSSLPLSDRAGEADLTVVLARVDAPAEPRPRRDAGSDAALDAVPDALLVLDARGRVRFANRALESLLGYTPAELSGHSAGFLTLSARDLDALLSAIAAGNKRPFALELVLRRRDGDPVVVAASGSAQLQDGGCVLSLRDVTRTRRTISELERKNRDLEHCVNMLAHDLRSPLVALLGFSRLLRQDYDKRLDDTGLHFVDRIEQAGRTMETLIHDLLELSRIGQSNERRGMVDPRSVLQQLHAELKPQLDASGIELLLPAHPPLIYCDRTRLYQVFSNLIGNAIEHMGPCPEPRIVVDVADDAEGTHVTVSDHGCGIAPEHHERIFEAFQSLSPRRGERRGAGIGLTIVRQIAKTHGGRAWVESRPGHGATFHLTFPRR
jgi:PAS domain S-box-containing protein